MVSPRTLPWALGAVLCVLSCHRDSWKRDRPRDDETPVLAGHTGAPGTGDPLPPRRQVRIIHPPGTILGQATAQELPPPEQAQKGPGPQGQKTAPEAPPCPFGAYCASGPADSATSPAGSATSTAQAPEATAPPASTATPHGL